MIDSVIDFPKKSTRKLLIDRNSRSDYIVYVVTRIPRLDGIVSEISVIARKLIIIGAQLQLAFFYLFSLQFFLFWGVFKNV